ncbi:MAG: YtxH domain-containing protein [Flavobacteriales bacterium]
MSDRTNGVIAFVAGIAAGAALGLLLAPQSGKETREQIGRKGREAKDALDDLIEEGREKWGEAKGKAADAATMTREEVDDLIRFLFKEGQDLWERLREKASTTAHPGHRPQE